MRPQRPSNAFTLIELLIVIAIIGILFPVAVALHARIETAAADSRERIEAAERATAALRRWRRDVSLARRIEVEPGGGAMRIERPGEDGEPLRIVYERGPDQALLRRVVSGAKPLDEPLTDPIEGLRFEAVGRGWRAHWTALWSDGVKTLRWAQGGIATPLAPAKEAHP